MEYGSIERAMPDMPLRVGLTELGRNKEWRKEVDRKGIVEISDRNKPKYFVVSPQYLETIDRYVEFLEEENERIDIEWALARRDRLVDEGHKALSGDALKEESLELLRAKGVL